MLVVLLPFLAFFLATATAMAYWSATCVAYRTVMTGTLAAPVGVTVPPNAAAEVPVSWTPGANGVAPAGYYVTRHTGATTAAACGSSPAAPVTGTGCTDTAVPDGNHSYVVTAIHTTWTMESVASMVVTVANARALGFVSEPTDTPAGEAIVPPVTVALRTADGDPFASPGVPVTGLIGTNPAGGTLAGTTTVDTDVAGVASFTNLSIDEPGTGYTLTATSPGLTTATSTAFAVTGPPLLGDADSFSVLAATAVVNTGVTTISGDVGVSPATTVTGFPPGIVVGDIHAGDAAAADAQTAFADAYGELVGRTADRELAGETGGLTFTAGVYHATAALAVTGTLTLDAEGAPDAVFVFQTDAAFNTAAASIVTLINGAQAANVYWVVTGAAGTGANSFLSGTILAQGAITLGASTQLLGRALSGGTVTLASNTIRFTAAPPPTVTINGGAALTVKGTTPTISGTSDAPASSPVTVTVAGQIHTTTVGSDGAWSITANALAAGVHDVVAKVRDPSGNGAVATQTLTVEVNPALVSLGTAGTYSVLAATGVVNTGATTLSGDLGVSPSDAVTGFPPGTLAGTVHAGDAEAAAAQADLLTALDEASSRAPHTEIVGNLGGRTVRIGVHHSTAALALTGTLTLDAEGDPDAVFIFQTDAAFNTAAASVVVLANGAQAANVFWVVTGAAGTGANSSLSGTILARGAITVGAGAVLAGHALSRDTVTLAGNTLTGVSPAPAPARPGAAPLAETAPPDETAPLAPAAPVEPTTPETPDAGTTEPTTTEATPATSTETEPSVAAPKVSDPQLTGP